MGVSSLFNVAIHINFVVESLVMLDNETFKGSILIAFKCFKQILSGRHFFYLVKESKCLLGLENNRRIDDWEVILENGSTDILIVLQNVIDTNTETYRCILLNLMFNFLLLFVR